jgi:hypothetical protein
MTRRFSCILSLFAGLLATGGSLLADTPNPALTQSRILENNVTYLRVGQVGKDLASAISTAQSTPATTNTIIGTVLDLRFADGTDHAAAAATANLFAAKKLPLTILVNDQTRGAAATLATTLQTACDGLILGAAVELKPGITVTVSAADERSYLKNPYETPAPNKANVSSAATNNMLPFIDHTSEAELVRKQVKDGEDDEVNPPARVPAPPVIRDPVLARAVDLLKALAILHPARA